MKPLTVSALLCAMAVLANAAEDWYVVKKSPCCSCGWTEYYNQCFVYVSKTMTWAEAQKNCDSMNANLASVRSLEEYKLIQKVISDASEADGRTWIGGSDAQQDSFWFWTDGARFQYTNWCPGEPNNNKGNEECTEMNFSGNKCMNDQNCQEKFPSVCVRRMGGFLG